MNSQDFFNLFNLKKGIDYINEPYIWDTTSPNLGFAILKNYPKGKKFIPAKNNLGEDDNIMLIRVFLTGEALDKDNVVIGVDIGNVSLYKLNNPNIFGVYNWEDSKCPTKESIEISKKSTQPIDLTEIRKKFVFNKIDYSFFDKDKNKEIKGQEVIEYIYKQHLETISNSLTNFWFRFRITFFRVMSFVIKWFGELMIKIIPKISGKDIENKYGKLFFEPFQWANPKGIKDIENNNLVEYEGLLKKINPFIFSIITIVMIILYVLSNYFGCNFFKIIDFIQKNKGDQIFSVILVAFVVLFFNYILPNSLLFFLNRLVLAYRKLSFKRIEL